MQPHSASRACEKKQEEQKAKKSKRIEKEKKKERRTKEIYTGPPVPLRFGSITIPIPLHSLSHPHQQRCYPDSLYASSSSSLTSSPSPAVSSDGSSFAGDNNHNPSIPSPMSSSRSPFSARLSQPYSQASCSSPATG